MDGKIKTKKSIEDVKYDRPAGTFGIYEDKVIEFIVEPICI